MNNTKVIANSINHHDYRLENDYINQNEDDTIRSVAFTYTPHVSSSGEFLIISRLYLFDSNKSYGSHKNRAFKDESHKGSMDSLNGEEKKDASKEDLEQEEGTSVNRIFKRNLTKQSNSVTAMAREELDQAFHESIRENPLSDLEDEGEEREELDEVIQAEDDPIQSNYPTDCCPENCYKKFPFLAGDDDAPFWQGWANLRLKTFQLIENKYFETAVITMILLSSLALVRSSFYSASVR